MTDSLVLDMQREERLGFSEAVLCEWKPVSIIEQALREFKLQDTPALFTRMSKEKLNQLTPDCRSQLDYCEVSQTAFLGKKNTPANKVGICIVAAGSSDIAAATEAKRTLAFHDYDSTSFTDIGVAGIWRFQEKLDQIQQHKILIVAAGMDAALVSVVGGLFRGPVIALPTSVGYGASSRGQTALNASLASCAPGVVVVNIDNGYGAAMAAIRAISVL